jgi:hypothetical protein
MALLLDAYMQWFHIGSYRLAGLFSQRGGLVHTKGLATFGHCGWSWKSASWHLGLSSLKKL